MPRVQYQVLMISRAVSAEVEVSTHDRYADACRAARATRDGRHPPSLYPIIVRVVTNEEPPREIYRISRRAPRAEARQTPEAVQAHAPPLDASQVAPLREPPQGEDVTVDAIIEQRDDRLQGMLRAARRRNPRPNGAEARNIRQAARATPPVALTEEETADLMVDLRTLDI